MGFIFTNVMSSYGLLAAVLLLVAATVCSQLIRSKRAALFTSMFMLAAAAAFSAHLILVSVSLSVISIISINMFSMLFVLLFAVAMMLVNVLSYRHSRDYTSFAMLASFSFAGIFIVATAASLISIFIGLEIMAITTAFMILSDGKHGIESATKFFILSSVSIAIFAFALALILPYSGQLQLSALSASAITGNYLIVLAIVLFAAALAFEAALFPFNLWTPDVYEGAPGNITALLAGVNKKVAFVALIEIFMVVLLAYKSVFSLLFLVLAIVTMFYGNIVAIVQKSVKRMFAYSSISQAGYIVIGLAAASAFGIEASIFQMVAHAFMIIGAFALILWLESRNIRSIDDYAGLNSRNRFAALSLSVLMLSMAGIPPLIGFDGKFLLFSSALSANMLALAVLGIINSFISIYYYARVINAMYTSKEHPRLMTDRHVAAVVIACLVVVVALGIYPQPLITLATQASAAILVL
ncbi:MAG: NADH-quinone oxidoreductase subunit N [Candidatus Micrarchaeota archaeon]|nr:NADH-quinone oxidoreductase subunit N [Candidatus Micrarchaeota archaeon]